MAANNHIGTALDVMKAIAEDNEWNYSHGNLTEKGLKNVTVFPLLHVAVQGISMGTRTTLVSLNISIADVVNTLSTENQEDDLVAKMAEIGYTENENYAHILQELYVRLSISLFKFERANYDEIQFEKPVNLDAFIEEAPQVLAGLQGTLIIKVISPWVSDGIC